MAEPLESLEERFTQITGHSIPSRRSSISSEEAMNFPGLFSAGVKLKSMVSPGQHMTSETKLEQNNSRPKDPTRLIPKPLIITIKINGQPARALVDSGSLSDFISTTLVDQLKLEIKPLTRPQACEMAASGSRTMIQSSCTSDFEFQEISEKRTFDVMNLENYDVLLGTPFLFQHGVMLGFNPSRIAVGFSESQPQIISPSNSLCLSQNYRLASTVGLIL